jgi:ribosomal protein S18 acetylase RimI-like enzyme
MSAPIRIVSEPATTELAASLLKNYFSELASRFPGGLRDDPSHAASPDELSSPSGAFLVAYVGDRPVGCGGLRRIDTTTAEIKHMWIDPSMRGRGLGRDLLSALEHSAERLGYEVVRLDTSQHLNEALRLYRSSGYTEIAPYNENPYAAHWFEKSLAPL